jgi:hypothetical protein
MLFTHALCVQVRFIGELLGHALFAPGQIWTANTATYASTVGFRLQSRQVYSSNRPDGSNAVNFEWQVQPIFFVSNP